MAVGVIDLLRSTRRAATASWRKAMRARRPWPSRAPWSGRRGGGSCPNDRFDSWVDRAQRADLGGTRCCGGIAELARSAHRRPDSVGHQRLAVQVEAVEQLCGDLAVRSGSARHSGRTAGSAGSLRSSADTDGRGNRRSRPRRPPRGVARRSAGHRPASSYRLAQNAGQMPTRRVMERAIVEASARQALVVAGSFGIKAQVLSRRAWPGVADIEESS